MESLIETFSQRRWRTSVIVLAVFFLSLAALPSMSRGQAVAEIRAILVAGESRTEISDVLLLQIKRVEDGRLEAASVGTLLFKNDEIRTGAGVQVNLAFISGDSENRIEVFMLENSKAVISSLFASWGRYVIRGFGIFDTYTENARLRKRLTEFQIDVAENGDAELKVTFGEVVVEKGEFAPGHTGSFLGNSAGQFINVSDARRPLLQTRSVTGGHGIRITRHDPLAIPRRLSNAEIAQLVDRTNILLLATRPRSLPSSTILTGFEAANDPVVDRRRAEEKFNNTRLTAALNPTAENTAAMAEAFKDLGQGDRAVDEYKHAAKKNPAVRKSFRYLAGEAEAHRQSGNLIKAEEVSNEALNLKVTTVPKNLQGALYNTRGNIYYDKFTNAVNKKDGAGASANLTASSTALGEARRLNLDTHSQAIIAKNTKNIALAFDSDPTIDTFTVLNGTYDGVLDFPAARAKGPAVMVVAGSHFTLTYAGGSLKGSIQGRGKSATGEHLFDFLPDTGPTIVTIALKATCSSHRSLELRSMPGKVPFIFSGQPRQAAGVCLQPARIKAITEKVNPN